MLRWILPLLFAAVLTPGLRAEDLNVLTADNAGGPPKQMVSRYLKKQVDAALERRKTAYEALKTPKQLAAHQERLRKEFVEHLGGFPERTDLNARVVGAIDADRYRVEKIIFESQPGHHVTAVLFLPTATKPPYPVVVMPCGHSANGKVSNQTQGIFLALNGIACLSYDPIGQGERSQFLDKDGKPILRSTNEHTTVGVGSIPLGRGTATYRIWDGMRAIDYVAGRKDIDAKKIGVTGVSGGGTLTSYLMALDDRVACAAPSCYLTSFRRLLETRGPQDAEQNVHGQLAFGMDHADYVMMRAPKPTLILAATQDFFDIQGTWDSFRQAKRFYTRLGFPERVELVETDTEHGYPRGQREAMVRWMRRWLAGKDEAVTEPEITPRKGDDYLCTPRGQVMLLDKERSVVDLNVELNTKLEEKRRELWKDKKAALAEVRRIVGVRSLADLPGVKATEAGTVERKGYKIEKLILETEPGIRLPALLFRPAKVTGKRYLYLHGEGKHADAKPDGPIEKLAQAGHLVLAVDVRGTGETGSVDGTWGGSSNDFFTAYLLGRSLVGMRTEDVLGCGRYLAALDKAKSGGRVELVAIGAVGPPALHAAALEPGLFDTVKLVRSLPSWSEVVRQPRATGQLVNTVHGALRAYDLPDLVATLPKDKVTIDEPLKLEPPKVEKKK